MYDKEVKRMTPEKAIEILKEDSIEVTLEEAKIILAFMYEMAEIVAEQYLENPGKNS
jgi:hypothetical protein